MTVTDLFSWANTAVLPFWLLLMVLPRARWVTHVLVPFVVPGILAVAYTVCVLSTVGAGPVDFTSLEAVRAMFQSDVAMLAGWLHYLAFDMFVGAWEARDAVRERVPQLLLVVCLFFTLMFGPMGMLMYLLVRSAVQWRRGEL